MVRPELDKTHCPPINIEWVGVRSGRVVVTYPPVAWPICQAEGTDFLPLSYALLLRDEGSVVASLGLVQDDHHEGAVQALLFQQSIQQAVAFSTSETIL